jgi:micrococcal nuclease
MNPAIPNLSVLGSDYKLVIAGLMRVILLLWALAGCCFARPPGLPEYALVRVVDGDTIVVTALGGGPEQHVRLLGIDCLEARRTKRLDKQATDLAISSEQAYAIGKETTEFVQQRLQGKSLYLETEAGLTDRYGRLLAHVWADQEHSLNLELLQTGQAMVYEGSKAFEGQDEFRAAELAARSEQVGIWGLRRESPEPPPSGSQAPASGEQRFVIFLLVLVGCAALIIVGLRRRR